jgi:hypothetical protein
MKPWDCSYWIGKDFGIKSIDVKGECEVVCSGFDLGSCCEVRSAKSAQAVPTIYSISRLNARPA